MMSAADREGVNGIRTVLPHAWLGLVLAATVDRVGQTGANRSAVLATGARSTFGRSDRRIGILPVTGDSPMAIQVTSTAFADGAAIPKKYTGDGEDVSPPLAWSGLPARTKELALICDDPDAPTAEPWVHWVIYKIPTDLPGLAEGIGKAARLKSPAAMLQGKNSWSGVGYRGPKPPPDHGIHHYFFKLYALEARLSVESGLTKATLLKEMADHVLGQGQLVGTYLR